VAGFDRWLVGSEQTNIFKINFNPKICCQNTYVYFFSKMYLRRKKIQAVRKIQAASPKNQSVLF